MDGVISAFIATTFLVTNIWGVKHDGELLSVDEKVRFAKRMLMFNMGLIGLTLILAYVYK